MSQVYVFQNVDGSYKYETVTGFVPKNAIKGKLAYDPITKLLVDPRYIQLEQIIDPESGELVPTFTIDAIKKAQVLSDDQAKIDQAVIDVLDKTVKDDAFIDSIINFDPEVINDLESIKEGFRTVKGFFDYYFAVEIKVKKDKDKVK